MDEFLFIVEDTFNIAGRGTVVTGRVMSGNIALNQMAYIEQPDGRYLETVIIGIDAFRKQLSVAHEGDACGLLLRNTTKNDVGRGYRIIGYVPSDYVISHNAVEEPESWFRKIFR